MTFRVGGVALSLPQATDVLFLEHGYCPADEEQARERVHRLGQQRPTTCHVLHAVDTIEDWLASLQEHKRSLEAVLRGERAEPAFHASLRRWLEQRRAWRHAVDDQPQMVVEVDM